MAIRKPWSAASLARPPIVLVVVLESASPRWLGIILNLLSAHLFWGGCSVVTHQIFEDDLHRYTLRLTRTTASRPRQRSRVSDYFFFEIKKILGGFTAQETRRKSLVSEI